jgi:hypothetical protein
MDKQREIADRQWTAMQGQATTMKNQLDEMEIARRPWVTADITPIGQLTND